MPTAAVGMFFRENTGNETVPVRLGEHRRSLVVLGLSKTRSNWFDAEPNAMNEIFRVKKATRNLGISSLLFFGGAMVVSICVCLSEAKTLGAAILGIAFFGGILGLFVGLSVWLLLTYLRESLCIHDETMVQKGVLRTKSMSLSELVGLQWRIPKAIILRSESQKIKVDLDNFESAQQLRLIRFFHRSAAPSIQKDWDRFCYKVATPLLANSHERPLQEDEILVTRRRYDWLFLPTIVLTAIAGIGFAWYLRELR
jgi:hypothetical protein